MQPCYWAIAKIPGLSVRERELLIENGIETTKDLLLNSQTSQARNLLANKLQLHIKHINKWTALADLARIPSVGDRYCGLLLHSGIASTRQLAQTPLQRLHPAIKRLYVTTTRRKDLIPSVPQVKKWIEEARLLMMNR